MHAKVREINLIGREVPDEEPRCTRRQGIIHQETMAGVVTIPYRIGFQSVRLPLRRGIDRTPATGRKTFALMDDIKHPQHQGEERQATQ